LLGKFISLAVLSEQTSFGSNQADVEISFARSVELDEQDGLPLAEDELAVEHRNREGGPKNGRCHV
jgi:hypothetical protein